MARPTFPLRFSHESLRELVRQVAAREGISQNELLEVAAEHEVVARGALLADELERTAFWLRTVSEKAMEDVVAASVASFAEAEGHPDLLRPRQIRRHDGEHDPPCRHMGAVAAFKQA